MVCGKGTLYHRSFSQFSSIIIITFRIIWIYQSICQRLSLPLYNTHPIWLSLSMNLLISVTKLSLVNLLLLINKFSFFCEGQSCRVCIVNNTVLCYPYAMHCSIVRCIHTLIYFMYLPVWVDSDGLAQNLGNSGADRCCRSLAQRLSCMILCVEGVCMILVCLSVLFIIQSDNSSSS